MFREFVAVVEEGDELARGERQGRVRSRRGAPALPAEDDLDARLRARVLFERAPHAGPGRAVARDAKLPARVELTAD